MYALTIDCGTQSLRAMVISPKGESLVRIKKTFNPYVAKEAGYAEQDPRVYYDSMCEAILQIKNNYQELYEAISGVTITTQRDAVICVDEEGQPIRDAIIWADQRRIKEPKPMRLDHKAIFMAIGMLPTAQNLSRNCKAHWLQDHEPDTWKRTHKYLQLSAYLNFKLTGRFMDGVASQIGHVPFSYKHRRWEHKHSLKHDIFHINNQLFCDLCETGEVIGYVNDRAALETGLKEGLAVYAAGSDKGCETLGVGVLDGRSASISLGSQASIQTTSRRYFETLRFIPPFQGVMPGYYNPEIQVYRGYWMISWFMKEFAAKEQREADALGISPEKILDQKLATIPAGSDGLLLQPYWGAGVKKHEARGAIIGFNDHHTRIHIYRSIIEGIGFALYEGMVKMEKRSKVKVEKIMISGGGANSDVICQITANIFKLPVKRIQTNEASSLGAAIAAYVGMGVFSSYEEAVNAMVHEAQTFYPEEKVTKVYDHLYHSVYKKLYGRLKPLYKRYQSQ